MQYFFLGDEELVIAFSFIGINGLAVKNSEEAVSAFRHITEGILSEDSDLPDFVQEVNDCQVLILTEETADWLGDYMINWQLSGHYPLLVEIPGIAGRHEGRKTLVESIREAIGLHV